MPLLNKLKKDLHKKMMDYGDNLTDQRLLNFVITKLDL